MGWFGYDIYDGDETQTRHYNFLKWGKVSNNDEEIENWLTCDGTLIPKEKASILLKNINLVLKKMPKVKFWNEEKALEWQMLGALFLDNKIKIPTIIRKNTILATEYLIGEHAEDFLEEKTRRRYLRKFIRKIKKLK